ncbi:taurine dioxygenase [Burkholderia cenocepacia]|nr:taurine dioxygenase [Burkholderia cenocepacia]ONJ11097.1 taurine dioxygenase [Burkholderia cenocepacia]ONN82697.1 taurine dioxygenase [Burkholderia cenocepacia]ONN91822.1 taurine dioxygenase [Burkholderia cenocepacia]ONN92474.1 taurine dioxygenase [Burkholderia cenocepacia]
MRPDGAAQHFDIVPFDAPLGAEVIGLDLSQPLDADDFARIHRAHLDHHVLVFRDQRITPDEHIAFSRRFGPLQIHVLHQFALAGHPEVLIVSNIVENGKPVGLGDAGHFWHSDLSYKEKPSLGSLLHAQELPAEGGDTLFANMHLAWDTLPADLRRAVEGRRAEHTVSRALCGTAGAQPVAAQPVARADRAGRRGRASGRAHASGNRPQGAVRQRAFHDAHRRAPEDESRALLDELFAHSVRAEHLYRHAWRDHDLVFWDNRSLMHLAAGTPDHLRRKLYRTTIEGDAPF